ncbi:KSR2 Kinase, partial [Thalassarche chlororhynchos]|nr:KSR2 Kinase [Thalassarche chlororhynchos]
PQGFRLLFQSKLVKYFSRQLSCKRKVALQERNAKLEGFPQLLHWFRIVDIRKEVMEEIAPGQLSLEELLDMTDDQVCATVEKFGANSEECARLNASLSCLRSVHKSGGSLSKQDWTIQWPTTEPGKENSPGCQPEPGQWGRTHLSQSPKVPPKCGQHHCHAGSPHGPMYTHVDRLTVEGHPGLCPPLESGHRSLPPSPRQRHVAHTPPRTPNIVTTMTPPGTPPVRRRNKLKPPGTPPPSSRKLIHLIPGFTALHRSKSHEFQLGHRVDEAHTPKVKKKNKPLNLKIHNSVGSCENIPAQRSPLLSERSLRSFFVGYPPFLPSTPPVHTEATFSASTPSLPQRRANPPPCRGMSSSLCISGLVWGFLRPSVGAPAPAMALVCQGLAAPASSQPTAPMTCVPYRFLSLCPQPGRAAWESRVFPSASCRTAGIQEGLPMGPLRQRAPRGCTQPNYYIKSSFWVEKRSPVCSDAPCSELHPFGRTVMLRIPFALASHTFFSVPRQAQVPQQMHQRGPSVSPADHPPRRCFSGVLSTLSSLATFFFLLFYCAHLPLPPPQNEEGTEEAQESEDDFEEMNLSLLSARNFPRKASQTSIFLQEWDIPFEQLEIGELIGKGRFGQVFHGRWHGEVAIRLIDIERDNEDQLKAFKREVMAYRQTRHENVVLFMGACMSPPHLAIITSLCKGRTLYSVVRDAKIVLDVNKTRQIAQEIVKGMGYLHAKGILHKDLKSKNVFYDNGKVVITDFGLFSISGVLQAGRRENKLRIQNGWLCHLAPEIIRQLSPDTEEDKLPFSKHSDVFALGTIWYELHAREWPFKTQPAEAIIWQVGRGMKPNLSQIGMGKEISDILLFCWAYEQEERPTFTKLMDMLEKLPKRNRRLSHPGHFWKSAE